MNECVAVAVPVQTHFMGNNYSAENEFPALHEGMNVYSYSGPVSQRARVPNLARAIASATGMSSGVVTLMLSWDPMNSLTG